MAAVKDVLNAALAIMNEQDIDGSYAERSVFIINTLIGQCWQISEDYEGGTLRASWTPVTDINDEISGIDKTVALSVMPYGLAALLYLDEDPQRSNSWWQLYQEGLDQARRVPTGFEPIVDVYGWQETESFGRW